MFCTKCGSELEEGARVCERCGTRVGSVPRQAPAPVAAGQGDQTGGLIPYKNPPALTAYYLGLFSIIPILGIILGAAGVVLGIKGLKMKKATPEVKGTAHAWVGIGCGGLGFLVWTLSVVAIIIAMVADK